MPGAKMMTRMVKPRLLEGRRGSSITPNRARVIATSRHHRRRHHHLSVVTWCAGGGGDEKEPSSRNDDEDDNDDENLATNGGDDSSDDVAAGGTLESEFMHVLREQNQRAKQEMETRWKQGGLRPRVVGLHKLANPVWFQPLNLECDDILVSMIQAFAFTCNSHRYSVVHESTSDYIRRVDFQWWGCLYKLQYKLHPSIFP
jgi:hypothetical protein